MRLTPVENRFDDVRREEAERTGRICCGIEIDPVYVDTTIRRWQAFAAVRY